MSNKNKKNKNWISKRSITLMCTIVAMVFVCIGIMVFIGLDGRMLFTDDVTVEDIEKRARDTINKYDYALLSLDIQETYAGEGQRITHYEYSSSRLTNEHAYVYMDDSGVSLYQYWDRKDDQSEEVVIYIYDDVTKSWVETSYPYEPVTSDTWSMLTDLSRYDVIPGTFKWFNSDDDCYVLEMLGSSDEFYQIYEQLYIRKSDFMPMGILSYAVSDVDYDRMKSNELVEDLNDDGTDESITVESPAYNELVQVYQIVFSEEDLKPFGVPEDYITEEEYNQRMSEIEESENNEE